jgi:hypothetical protein
VTSDAHRIEDAASGSRLPRVTITLVATAVAVVGVVLTTTHGGEGGLASSLGLVSSAGQGEVVRAIQLDVPRGVTVHDIRCHAVVGGEVRCTATVANAQGSGLATYHANIDSASGRYKLDPIVSIRHGGR